MAATTEQDHPLLRALGWSIDHFWLVAGAALLVLVGVGALIGDADEPRDIGDESGCVGAERDQCYSDYQDSRLSDLEPPETEYDEYDGYDDVDPWAAYDYEPPDYDSNFP
jgi:hypothetical protein